MRLSQAQREALNNAITALDLVEHDELAGALAQILAQDEAEAIAIAYDYEDEAKTIIKQVIKDNSDKYDINELLYNAEEVASEIDDYIFSEWIEQVENEAIKKSVNDPEGYKRDAEIARERIFYHADLVRWITGEMCMNYEEIVDALTDTDLIGFQNQILRYFASDYTAILEVIAEMTKEEEKA